MKVLITGSSGYLGQNLVKIFKDHSHEVLQVSRTVNVDGEICDLSCPFEVKKTFEKYRPDLVIHCAAFVPKSSVEYQNNEITSFNSSLLSNVLENTQCPIFYISSMTVYGPSKKIIRHENEAGQPESSYGESKLEGERLLKRSGRRGYSIRLPGLFGGARETGLIANTFRSFSKGVEPNLPDNPVLWSAMNVYDAAMCIFRLSQLKVSGYKPVNVGYSGRQSINKFIAICEQIFDKTVSYNIIHPEFEFDLTYLSSCDILSDEDLASALLKYKISLYESK